MNDDIQIKIKLADLSNVLVDDDLQDANTKMNLVKQITLDQILPLGIFVNTQDRLVTIKSFWLKLKMTPNYKHTRKETKSINR